jgi:hypothetical protein
MKKICIALFACLAIFSLSCKKSNSGKNSAFIKVLSNDTARTFNVNAIAHEFKTGDVTLLSITGNANTSTIEGIALQIKTAANTPIIAGTYSELDTDDFVTTGQYDPNKDAAKFVAGGVSSFNPLKIVITSIDDKTVKGTFSGAFFFTSASSIPQPSENPKNFTQGEFSVNF